MASNETQEIAPSGNPADVNERVVEVDRPIKERLAYKTKFHDEILGRLISRREMGERFMASKSEYWDAVDNHLRGRIDLTAGARYGDGTYSTTKKEMPFRRSVVVPISLAVLEVRRSQQLSLHLLREPPWPIEGVGPEDILPAKIMEAAIGYDLRMSDYDMVINQLIMDDERYNCGVVYDSWERNFGWKVIPPKGTLLVKQLMAQGLGEQEIAMVKQMFPAMFSPTQEWGLLNEYNSLTNIDPRELTPDPRVSFARVQDGEFIGHSKRCGLMHLIERSEENGGPYFNIDAVKKHCGGRWDQDKGSRRHTSDSSADELDRGTYRLYHLQVKLIPKEWKLGAGTRPEIWWFTWVDDEVIIRAHKSQYAHNQFTYAISEGMCDIHSTEQPGWGELLHPLQLLMNWLWNSHIDSVRRRINGALLYSPALIEEEDLLNPTPGGHVRLTPRAEQLLMSGQITPNQLYGSIIQTDTTESHLRDMNVTTDMIQRITASNDTAQGVPLPDKRTLGEVQAVLTAASQRIAMTARNRDAQAIKKLAKRAISNRQQLTTLEQWMRIPGDLAQELERSAVNDHRIAMNGGIVQVLVSREDLWGQFDYVSTVGSQMGDPQKNPQTWMQIMQAVAGVPSLIDPNMSPDGRTIDMREIFNEGARALGVRDISRFYKDVRALMMQKMQERAAMAPANVSVVTDEQYQRGIEAGDYVDPSQV